MTTFLVLVGLVLVVLAWKTLRDQQAYFSLLLNEQRDTIDRLSRRVMQLERAAKADAAPAARPLAEPTAAPEDARPAPPVVTPPAAAPERVRPTPGRLVTPPLVTPPPTITQPTAVPPPIAAREDVGPSASPVPPPAAEAPAAAASAALPALPPRPLRPAAPVSELPAGAQPPLTPPPPPAPPAPPAPPSFDWPAFDWERLVGVRLFSAMAGIALVIAAVLFLRYSIEHGWLTEPVRAVIGIATGIALLVVCELKAARKYPVTANALDAAAIAILFATFFASYSRWQLIPAAVAFGLLAVVTTIAVLLSIRRDSIFIAVLGLLGGFATPVLLSSGENRPIGLFSYLLLLNLGLAWVAYRQRWPVLSILTFVLTTLYQWGWVGRYLDASQLPLAIGIFVLFAVVGFASLIVAGVNAEPPSELPAERVALAAAAMPLVFAFYFAAVPEYREQYWLLFGFLLLVDAGLFAVAAARGEWLLHAGAAVTTVLVFAVWLAQSYTPDVWAPALGFASVFVLFYLFAPALATRLKKPPSEIGGVAVYAAPVLLFVFAALARQPAADNPLWLFTPLLVLTLIIAWRAMTTSASALYYTAAFMGLAAEAFWSMRFLRTERLGAAVTLYTVFALLYLGVPLFARRSGRPLLPEGASGVVLLASLGLLGFLTTERMAVQALWGFALLLAILNASLVIESAVSRLPLTALIGSAASWFLLAIWWMQAGGAVGVMPSLLVLVGFTLLMLGGYSWARRTIGRLAAAERGQFQSGLYIALVVYLFLAMLAIDPRWSLPPWPLFGALTVVTLAFLAVAVGFIEGALHLAAILASAFVLAVFAAGTRNAPWPLVSIGAFAVLSAVALVWILPARRLGFRTAAAPAAAMTLAIGALSAIVVAGAAGAPHVGLLIAWHAAVIAILLTLSITEEWPHVALGSSVFAAFVIALWHAQHPGNEEWLSVLAFTGVLLTLFVAFPLALGRRAREAREPFIAAIVASVWALFAARHAFIDGGYEGIVGIVPVVLGAIMALLLRQLLRLEPPGARDLGRLALVAATALGFVTVAIPLQLRHQWITIGWALEGAALAWLFTRIPHRGLLYASAALLGTVFVRLALNPEVFRYEPRGSMRILNWYLYAYLMTAAAMFAAAWLLSKTDDAIGAMRVRVSGAASAAGVVLLFILLNIEIADYYATGPEIMFRFGAGIAQDLTYTIGWLLFGLGLLAGGIALHNRSARGAAVALIAVTTLKCFLYDLGSLEGLYRVAAFLGLFVSLTLVAVALQKFVLIPRREAA